MTIHNVIRVLAVLLFMIGLILTPVGNPYAWSVPFERFAASGVHWKLGLGLVAASVVLFFVSMIKNPDI